MLHIMHFVKSSTVKKAYLSLFVLGGVVMGVALFANYAILRYERYVVGGDSEVPTSTWGVVFGGGMVAPGVMTQMQTDRVTRGIELYRAGKISKLFITGDDGGLRSDEVTYMKQYALGAGVREEDVVVDKHGYRTYESCYREKNLYGIDAMIAISNEFHLPRIAYLCRSMGIETIGVGADLSEYGLAHSKMRVREMLARVKAVWQMEVTKPLPRSLDK